MVTFSARGVHTSNENVLLRRGVGVRPAHIRLKSGGVTPPIAARRLEPLSPRSFGLLAFVETDLSNYLFDQRAIENLIGC